MIELIVGVAIGGVVVGSKSKIVAFIDKIKAEIAAHKAKKVAVVVSDSSSSEVKSS